MKTVLAAFGLGAALLGASLPAHASAACATDRSAPAQTPVVHVPTAGGPAYGAMQYPLTVTLAPKQVALTFDDGPDPATTLQILDTLDLHCVKATFFMVGIYAERHPEIVREVAARGHTIGSHTWSHPNNLRHLSLTAAKREIRRGFDAIETALASAPDEQRERLAPFFRFPGLNDSKALIAWLGERNIATLSCEFGSDDWRRISPWEVKRRSLRNIASVGQGILILHDTKPRTAAMLSGFIVELRAAGYELVQLVPEAGAHELAAAGPDPLLRPKPRAATDPMEQSASLDALTIPSLEPQGELR